MHEAGLFRNESFWREKNEPTFHVLNLIIETFTLRKKSWNEVFFCQSVQTPKFPPISPFDNKWTLPKFSFLNEQVSHAACLRRIFEAIHASLLRIIDEAKKRYIILHHLRIGSRPAHGLEVPCPYWQSSCPRSGSTMSLLAVVLPTVWKYHVPIW